MFNNLFELRQYVSTIDIEEIELNLNLQKYIDQLETWGWGSDCEQICINPFTSEMSLKNGKGVDHNLAQMQFMMMREKAKTECFWIRLSAYESDSVAVNLFKNLHFIFPEMCQEISDEIYSKLGVRFDLDKIGLLKSDSNIAVHQDQPARVGAINIFLKNGETANYNCHSTFTSESKYKTVNTKTGTAYLINTNSWHSVEKLTPDLRYAFSISIQ